MTFGTTLVNFLTRRVIMTCFIHNYKTPNKRSLGMCCIKHPYSIKVISQKHLPGVERKQEINSCTVNVDRGTKRGTVDGDFRSR